jgi:uncharacterized membrane protein
MRGLAVLIMIEAHVIDGWTRAADRATDPFGYSLILGGFGAPLFMFLAGVAVPLSAASKLRRMGSARAAARAVERRGLEIFLLGFLFRFQSFVLGHGAPWTLLIVDVLNIMGPSIMAAAWLWLLFQNDRVRVTGYAATAAVVAFVTPAVRDASWIAPLPDFLEGYLRPIPELTHFSIFPWAAFVPAGAVVGVLIGRTHDVTAERSVNARLLGAGVALAVGAYACSFLPSFTGPSYFWTSSPAFFFLRSGIMAATVGFAYFSERWRPAAWGPLAYMGRSSLFIYWIHVEMVYGLISRPLHRALPLPVSWTAFGVFSVFLLGCAFLKDHLRSRVTRWRQSRVAAP